MRSEDMAVPEAETGPGKDTVNRQQQQRDILTI